MTRIAFDARLFDAPPTGIGRWTRGLLTALVDVATDDEWVALGPSDAIEGVLGDRPNLTAIDTRPRRHLLWQMLTLPGLLARADAQVFLSPWNLVTSPRFGGRQVTWLHDLIPFRATEYGFRITYRWKTQLTLWLARRKMERMVVVSQFTADDATSHLELADGVVHVVHPGIDHDQFAPVPEAA